MLVVLATAGLAGAAELERLAVRETPAGAEVRLECSRAVTPAVREVAGEAGKLVRVYLDLPRGTRVAASVPRLAGGAGPVASLRVGATAPDAPRVVVDLGAPATWGLGRGRGGRVVVLRLAAAPPLADRPAASAAAAPGGDAPPAAAAAGDAPAPSGGGALGLARPKIVIDPGHGGRDPGARGYGVEKHVTLAIARRLAFFLRTRLGAETILTRTDDRYVALPARTARANAAQADLFVSIHANASPGGRLHGIETYYLDNTADHATIRLARLENGTAGAPGGGGSADLRYILSDLVQVGKMDDSIALAGAIQSGLVGRLRAAYPGVEDLGVKRGPFYVLVGAYMPCVLVETSFLTHPTEGRRLAGATYQEAVAEGLYAGIARFLAEARRARTL